MADTEINTMRLRKNKVHRGTCYHISMRCECSGNELLSFDWVAPDYLPRNYIAAELRAVRAMMREKMKRHALL